MRAHGFTLLEVLLAVAITAIIGMGAYYLFDQATRAEQAMKARSAQFEALQRTVAWLETDLSQAVPRVVRGEYGEPLYSMSSRNILYTVELTRTGWTNYAGGRRSELQRVAWQFKDDTLYRKYWRVLDRAQDTLPREQKLLGGVSEFEVRFMDEEGTWHEDWPSQALLQSAGDSGEDASILPRAVSFTLETKVFGRITRLIEVPAGRVPEAAPATSPPEGEGGEG
ncbi:MAG: type II secretion system protein GspJ [Gammaproteobacteria bacterium]|nr:MAG: type II secretion system protein GspJ [Gammaproteobacteria bacterium]